MVKSVKHIESVLNIIYLKYVRRYKHKDTKQMCCMWSLNIPPEIVHESNQLCDIEDEFSITFTEDESLSIYDMDFIEAVNFLHKKINDCVVTKI